MNKPTEEELTQLIREDMGELRNRLNRAPRRVRMIEESTRALRMGCWAVLPFLGLAFGPIAFKCYVKSRILTGLTWNPAKHHAACGGILGVFGFLVSLAWMLSFLH